ncbi:menaquinone biosynthesis protein [Streptomyces sp. NPDC006632]|uniref:menaquinone biosynthetic enzyme MqnA/MqnD family protein n=1 Tax=Streptomyces sp. NPDC006632 TaxID=3157182 RepID=UPI0033BFAA6E
MPAVRLTDAPLTRTARSVRRPQVGFISFLNCRPIQWGLERSELLHRIDLVSRTPEQVSDRLVDGRLDLGPITLVEYLRHIDELLLLPALAIGADGPVMSCAIVSGVPLTELGGRDVALGSTSRTTTLLARFLLEDRMGLRPRYFPCEPSVPAMLARGDAGVVIGDPALRAHFDAAEPAVRTPGVASGAAAPGRGVGHGGVRQVHQVHDTAAMWREWTGLPMVFAVWAVRREFAERHPAMVAYIHRELVAARDHALREPASVSADAAEGSSFTPDQLALYYRTLCYDLSAAALDGMRHYQRLAARRGIVDGDRSPVFFTPDSPRRAER